MADLSKFGVLDRSLWSYNTQCTINDREEDNPLELDSVLGWRDAVRNFISCGPYFCDSDDDQVHNDHRRVPVSLYQDSYCHLVLETLFDADQSGGAFLTEKTYKSIKFGQPFVIIGERINPTGRKIFQEKLRAGDLSTINIDVEAQVAGGADVLDVNMGVPLTDEPALLAAAIKLVQSITDLPICIDSSVHEALEAGLAVYQGKALVNSVTGEDDRMEIILPLVKKYGAAIIALPNDETGIPATAKERLDITEKIVRAIESYKIPLEDLVIDPLAMTVGADPEAVKITLETIHLIKEKFGLNMTLGASNVSFGLPSRHALNAAFIPIAMSHGLTSAVMDSRTPEIVSAVRAADLLLGTDAWGGNWISRFRAQQAALPKA